MPESDHEDEELQLKLKQAFGSDSGGTDPSASEPIDPLAPPDTSELEFRMKSAIQGVESLRHKQAVSAEEVAKSRKLDQESARSLGVGMQIAYTIIGFPVLGFGAGALLDVVLKANIWKGIVGMLGCLFGVGIVIMLINRANASS